MQICLSPSSFNGASVFSGTITWMKISFSLPCINIHVSILCLTSPNWWKFICILFMTLTLKNLKISCINLNYFFWVSSLTLKIFEEKQLVSFLHNVWYSLKDSTYFVPVWVWTSASLKSLGVLRLAHLSLLICLCLWPSVRHRLTSFTQIFWEYQALLQVKSVRELLLFKVRKILR